MILTSSGIPKILGCHGTQDDAEIQLAMTPSLPGDTLSVTWCGGNGITRVVYMYTVRDESVVDESVIDESINN